MKMRSISLKTSGAPASASRVATQKSNLLNVVMPMETRPDLTGSAPTNHPLSLISRSSSARTSNQYQPPCSKLERGNGKRDRATPSTAVVSTMCVAPVASERITVTTPRPAVVTRRTTSRTAVQCCQYEAGKALKYVERDTDDPARSRKVRRSQAVTAPRSAVSAYRAIASWVFSTGKMMLCTVVEGEVVEFIVPLVCPAASTCHRLCGFSRVPISLVRGKRSVSQQGFQLVLK